VAQARKKRNRKHRGTQAGTVERRSGGGKAAGAPAKSARDRRMERFDRPPTWRGAFNRAAIAALIFGVFVILVLGRPIGVAALLAAFMLLVYVPLSYLTDVFIYRRRQRKRPPGASGTRR